MQKAIALLLIGCAYTNAVETSSLRTKLKGLAQLSAQGNNGGTSSSAPDLGLPDCNLTAPDLGDLSGDLLDWCPDNFGANAVNLGSAINVNAQETVQQFA